jgi:outer membrane lipoprotein-sorting protein
MGAHKWAILLLVTVLLLASACTWRTRKARKEAQ